MLTLFPGEAIFQSTTDVSMPRISASGLRVMSSGLNIYNLPQERK